MSIAQTRSKSRSSDIFKFYAHNNEAISIEAFAVEFAYIYEDTVEDMLSNYLDVKLMNVLRFIQYFDLLSF